MDEKPLPHYFANKWQRAPERLEDDTNIQGASGEASKLRAEFILPPDSEITDAAMRISLPQESPRLDENYTPEGTYIPLSGGIRGWYENSGVMKSETRNGYGFHGAVDGDAFKNTILERIETFNRRAVVRVKVDLWVGYQREASTEQQAGFCLDLSVEGARLRTREALEVGDRLRITMHRTRDAVGEGVPLVSVQAEVRNFRLANPNQAYPRYYTGIGFKDLEIAAKEAIARLVAEGQPLPGQETAPD